MNLTQEEKYMKLAIREAQKAAISGDVPIGCIIVYDGTDPNTKADKNAEAHGILPGTIIGRGYNKRNKMHSSLMHAEIIAIKKACKAFDDWRLEDCTMYVTLEPCPMCAGAIIQARIPRVVIGAMSQKSGCCGSILDMLHEERFNHQCEVTTELLLDDCTHLMTDFFRNMRNRER